GGRRSSQLPRISRVRRQCAVPAVVVDAKRPAGCGASAGAVVAAVNGAADPAGPAGQDALRATGV
ncbi:MAG TPA: hypothetical protein VN823_12490, partial [Stellaceae bacterium]|nr:hypothetical protein [Stellaceae bacterium]